MSRMGLVDRAGFEMNADAAAMNRLAAPPADVRWWLRPTAQSPLFQLGLRPRWGRSLRTM
jgi:hypothetical protein